MKELGMHSVGAMLAVRAELKALLDDLPAVVRVYPVLVRLLVRALHRASVASFVLRSYLFKGDAMIRQLMLFKHLKSLSGTCTGCRGTISQEVDH